MGGGDIKLLFVTGLYLGWERNILVIFFACIIGIIIGCILQRMETSEPDSKDEAFVEESTEEEALEEAPFYFAFGPSIAVSAVLVLFFGNMILQWYLSMF